jgi:RimJ/RimL family protein N-acetyltransferase
MRIAETARLTLRHLRTSDAPFVLQLVNEPAWLRYIGDRDVRDLADAERYIEAGPMATYAARGFGLYHVALTTAGTSIGICGLIKRDGLDDVDLGFAFLPEHWGRGYAVEAGAAVIARARAVLGLPRLVAITSPDNDASGRVLRRLGFAFERRITLTPDGEQLLLYGADLQPGARHP